MQYFEERDGKLIFRYNGETVQVEAWGQDSLRVRSRVLGEISEECSALTEEVAVHDAVISIQGEDSAEITNGRIKAVLYRQGWGNALQITFYNEKRRSTLAGDSKRWCIVPESEIFQIIGRWQLLPEGFFPVQ